MYQRPALLGQVRLAQIPSWGPASAPAPMSPMAPSAQAQAQAPAAAPEPPRNIPNSLYAGGAVVAIMAAIGALLA